MRQITTLFLFSACILPAQTIINGGRTIQGPWDASGATMTKPVRTGDSVPPTCSAGEIFFLTSAAAGQNLYLCQPADSWTQLTTSSAGAAMTGQSNTFAAGTTDTFHGTLDASAATATSPIATGSVLPGTCVVGQTFLLTGGDPSRMLYICSAANTWSQSAYTQGTVAQKPSTCVVGQMYFATDAPAGQNLYLCSSTNTWAQLTGGSVNASGAANQVAYFSGASALVSDNKITRDSSGNLTAASFNISGGAAMNAYSVNASYRLFFGAVETVSCTAGAVSLSSNYSVHRLNLNNQSSCAISIATGANTGMWFSVLMCQGSTTATTSLTWSGAKGGMPAGGGTGQCAAQNFLYDTVNNVWYATSGGSSWN